MKRLLLLAAALLASPLAAADAPPRFAEELYVFKVEDESLPPPPCATLFVGSSSIRFWFNLKQDFTFPLVRRGFGGSTIADVNANFDRLVAQYRPSRIVFYAGENDLASGATPDQAQARFAEFMARKDAALGATPVWFLAAKPSPSRWDQFAAQSAFNAGVARLARERRDLAYVDVVTPMLKDGKPQDALYISDRLHMTAAGYAIWRKVLTGGFKAAKLTRAPGCAAR
ncbi:GDSL-type esterase/lipase family protein [Novosphingobium sp. B 225]|uniref:GDSL-type esterase/lipase family protein n=1 Tax=Novosphingobium sp. B 225 TaxID=1961849 RepID=UPI000B4A6D22|nr:GDSL-type esterase/lipase family protein [Novosphingobium sp. B 225]